MKRIVLGLLCAAALAGCTSAKECSTVSDCPSGASCVDGLCVAGTTGGGSGGGTGGGGTGGGGTGGGGTGGGIGGGGGTGGGGMPQAYCADAGLSCAEWQECAPTPDGGECVSAGYSLTWVTPDAGLVTNQSMVNGVVRVTKMDGGSISLLSLPVSGATGAFSGSAGLFTGTLELAAPDGDKTFVAGWQDAGIFESLTISRDTTPPSVDVVIEPRPSSLGDADPVQATAWKLDEAATIRVTVTNGVPAVAGNVQVPWNGAVTSATCQAACTGDCRCFAVELAGTSVIGLRDTAWLQVRGISDATGNPAATVDAGIAVSRMKWARTMTLASAGLGLRPVAVSPSGAVVWGVEDAPATSPRLQATQQDGGTAWTAITAGTITAGPVVGSSNAWIGTNTGATSQFAGFVVGSGAPITPDCLSATAEFTGDLALAVPSAGSEFPVGVRNGQVRAGDGTCNAYSLPDAGDTSIPTVAVQTSGGATEAFVSAQGDAKLWKQTLSGTNWAGNGWATLPSGTQPRGLFFDGTGRVGGGGGGVAGNGAVFATSAAGSLSGTVTNFVTASNASAPIVGNGYALWTNTTGVLTKVSYATGMFGSPQTSNTSLGNLQAVMPVLGAGELIYLLGPSGRLSVRRATDLTEVWGGDVAATSGTSPTAQLALDVYRGASGAKACGKPVGVLYVLTKQSATATLSAVLVDSAGLQADAPWPKYQRDNGNRANISQPLSPWTCP